jgi:hypothetical protein
VENFSLTGKVNEPEQIDTRGSEEQVENAEGVGIQKGISVQKELDDAASDDNNAPKFPFKELPQEVRLLILEAMLVAPEGISNPWLQGKFVPLPNGQIGYIRQSWSKNLRPNILQLVGKCLTLEPKILYGKNKFRIVYQTSYREVHMDSSSFHWMLWFLTAEHK